MIKALVKETQCSKSTSDLADFRGGTGKEIGRRLVRVVVQVGTQVGTLPVPVPAPLVVGCALPRDR
jgi:hypothetical protein